MGHDLAMVAVGGALGSLARYLVAGAVQPAWWPGFPFGIFVVNITGGLVDGPDHGAGGAEAQSDAGNARLPHHRHPGRLHDLLHLLAG